MTNLIDPEFKYHQVTTRVWTEITMTLADDDILPFNVTHYGVNMKEYNRRIRKDFGSDFSKFNATKELG